MDLADAILKTVRITGTATVLHKPGAVRLDGFPLLVHAPGQHGPGIRTEDNGTPVEDLCLAAAENPNLDAVAARFGTTVNHLLQALDYAAKAGFVTL